MESEDIKARWLRVFAPLVWLALIQVFVLCLMASSPNLHEHLHDCSHDSDHHCLATDFGSGAVYQTPIAPILTPVCTTVHITLVSVTATDRQWLPAHLCGSLLEHGPPAFA